MSQDRLEAIEAIEVKRSFGRRTPSKLYPDKLSVDSNCGGGYINKTDLKRRGWTERGMKIHLGSPVHHSPALVYRGGWRILRADRPQCWYLLSEVLAIEAQFDGKPPRQRRRKGMGHEPKSVLQKWTRVVGQLGLRLDLGTEVDDPASEDIDDFLGLACAAKLIWGFNAPWICKSWCYSKRTEHAHTL